jgi:asparagine synthase (glutamine-hydrolysing)
MCGIAGVSGRPAAEFGDAVLERIAHRGPDGSGRYASPCGSTSLWHTRLAIQDPSPDGAQPMQAVDAKVVITFNGEIYNFRELRTQLQGRGYVFRSHSDTEVLLALYLEYGTALLEKVNGIFAFAIWDARDSSLFIARDGLGVKPLYISEAGGSVAFASEIKALLCFPWIPRDLDAAALFSYLRYLWCPAPRTPLVAIRKLQPGEAVLVRNGTIVRRWKHYALPVGTTAAGRPVDDWVRDVRDGIATAVERQMVSDVPLGAFLSGGLDSSAVVACAVKHAAGRLQCFTIDFDAAHAAEEGFVRDLPYARRVARHLDVDLHVVRVGSEMADELARMVWQLDEPQADLAGLNVLFISRLARRHGIKVLLSGAGGDDLFSGYRRHRALGLSRLWDCLPHAVPRAMSAVACKLPARPPLLRRAARLLSAASLEGDSRIAAYFDWNSPAAVRSLFGAEVALQADEEPLLQTLHALPAHTTPLQRMLLLEQRYFLADHNLNYTDKMSMAAGVETRVPFLDPDLLRLAARIPDTLKQNGAHGKWILKKTMEGVLPREIIYRPKTGFGVPLRAWLRQELRPVLHDLLGAKSVRARGLFRASAVAKMLEENDTGRGDHAYGLLSLMCIELWCRQFVDASPTTTR